MLSLGMAWTHFASRSHMFSVGKELAPRDSNCLSMLARAALCNGVVGGTPTHMWSFMGMKIEP